MNLTEERLYNLLPALYRLRDAESGGPLRALVSVLVEQARLVESDISSLYENQFIETCAEWAVPYLGDLLGVQALHPVNTSAGFTQRGFVANALAYRRRKGTAAVLEQLAFDTTGWRARAVEFFERLEWTQHQNHIRLPATRTPDLRRTDSLELLDTAFETACHSPDVRNIRTGRGRYNLGNIGLFVWRLASYLVRGGSAGTPAAAPPGGFTFDPLGRDLPLFNRPQTETEITHLAEEINVPAPLRRRPLYDELEARRQALVLGREPRFLYFDDRPNRADPPVLQVILPGASTPIPADEILVCHLGEWTPPPATRGYPVPQPDGSVVFVDRAISVAVDPVLGRLMFPAGLVPATPPRVDFNYAFSGDLGGGPYNRSDSVAAFFDRKVTWPVAVSRDLAPVPGQVFSSLADAIAAWNQQPAGQFGLIAVMDSATYAEDLAGASAIVIPEGSRLFLLAADWRAVRLPGGLPGQTSLLATDLDPDELRPHLHGHIEVRGTAPAGSETPGELILNGLLVEGRLDVLPGNLGRLALGHSTFVPNSGGIAVSAPNADLGLTLTRTICGPVVMPGGDGAFIATDSILDAASGHAVDAPDNPAAFHGCTVFGPIRVRNIEAENSLFQDAVLAARRQEGCVRFCYVPSSSQVPRRHRCQPALALAGLTDPSEIAATEARLRPSFTSRTYGDPAYAQLGPTCADEIRTGADDGSEFGAFQFLQQPQRHANLVAAIDPFLRFGLEAGVIHAT